MSRILVIRRVIHVAHGWDDGLWRRAAAFWQERGFRFEERLGARQTGRRGSLWGNYTAYDMSKLLATMTLRRVDVMTVEFLMEIDTTGQFITEWNALHWQMEMETLESWLLEGDKQEERWKAFGKKCCRANLLCTLTWGPVGTRLPRD